MTLEEEFERKTRVASNLDELAKPLEELLSGSLSIWHDGRLYCIKGVVERIRDVKVVIQPNDHPPPHFHVIGQDFTASFDIETGDLIVGQIDPVHYKLIRKWHSAAVPLLKSTWQKTRPGP
jgi:hypothetical protein